MEKSIKSIIELHPKGVAQLFSKYDIDAPVTVKNVRNAVSYFGDTFLYDLQEISGNTQLSSFLGLFESKEKRDAKKAKHLAEGKKPLSLEKVIGIGSDIVQAIKGKPNSEISPANESDVNTPDRILGISKNLFLTMSALLIVLTVIVLSRAKN